jgi:hypothetical protein
MHILTEKLIIKQELEWPCVHFFSLKFGRITLSVVV